VLWAPAGLKEIAAMSASGIIVFHHFENQQLILPTAMRLSEVSGFGRELVGILKSCSYGSKVRTCPFIASYRPPWPTLYVDHN
jgi:hypothetical protein